MLSKCKLFNYVVFIFLLCFPFIQLKSDIMVVDENGKAQPLIVIGSDGKKYLQLFGPAPDYEKKPLIPFPPNVDPNSYIRFIVEFPNSQMTIYEFYDLPHPLSSDYFECVNNEDYQNCYKD